MYNAGKITAGLIVFAILVTFPFLANFGKRYEEIKPSLDTPVINEMAVKKCVESKEYMRAEHMKVLNDWRDSVVRDGNRIYVSSEGKEYVMSLQNTCMNCHSNKKEFCDKCHTTMAVKPYCWDCHIAPKETKETTL